MADFNIDRRTALVLGWASMFVPGVGLLVALFGYIYYENKDKWLRDAFRILLNTTITFVLILGLLMISALFLRFIPFIGPLIIMLGYLGALALYFYTIIKGLIFADKTELFVSPIYINIIK